MEGYDAENTLESPRPKTVTVLGLLTLVAAVFSYLVAYAVANALVAADLMSPWPSGGDPRPRWFATTFASLMGSFLFFGGIARFLSWRQLRRIDAMASAESGRSIDNPLPPTARS